MASGRRAAALVVARVMAGAFAMRRVDESSCLRVNIVGRYFVGEIATMEGIWRRRGNGPF